MAYSLNPKDLREELKTYKQPVFVASTQPAQQTVAPASTSQYRQVKRADGGTDFYNGNQKTTIEEFSKATGNNVDAVRGQLAAGGSKFDQDVLTKQYFETKDPEVTQFNRLGVDQQRQRIAQLKDAASRRSFNTVEDAKNQRWASEQLANVEKFGTKKEGNLLTLAQDFVGGLAAPGAQIVNTVMDSSQQTLRHKALNELAKQGMSEQDYNSALRSIYQNSVDTKFDYNDQGKLVKGQLNPLEFAGNFSREAADAGLTYMPLGAGYKSVAGLALKDAAPTIAKNIFKEGTAYTVANTVNDVLQGREITPGSLLINAATSYGGAALGAGTALAKPGFKAAGNTVATGAKNVARAVENVNPQLAQINETLDNYKRAFDVETNPVRREQINQGIAQLNTQRRRILERGSIQVPGGKDPLESLRQEARKYKSADEFAVAQWEKANEFRDGHRAPSLDSTPVAEKLDAGGYFSLEEVAKGYHNQPGDYFDPQVGARYYSYDTAAGKESYKAVKSVIDGTAKTVKAYRTVPNGQSVSNFNDGDWVTFSKTYAEQHGQSRFGDGEYKMIEQDVKPKDLHWDGNDLNEWGYDTGKTWDDAVSLYNQATQQAPQVTKTPKQPATQKSAFEADLEAAGLTPYRKQSKAMREAVDQAVYETDPLLFESGSSGLFEGGIPRIKPSSIKEVTGLSARESGIPPRYLSEKDGVALDRLAAEFEGNRSGGQLTMTSEDMLDVVKKELDTRAVAREQKKLLAEMRNDPEIQKRAEVISRTDPESGLYIDEPLALQRENQIAADLEAAGIAAPRQAKTKFTRTVKGSAETSDKLRAAMRGKEGSYTTVTDEQRLFQSDKFLKSRSLKEATTDIKDRLIADKIDDQKASDAIAVAKRLDARSTTKSLQEATEIYEQLAEKFSKAGQLVQAASLLGNRTPEGLRFSAIKSLKREGVTITPEMTKKIDGFIQEVKKTKAGSYENGLARNNLMQYVAKQLPQRKMSQILQVWKAGLLTSPRTTAGNLAANTAETVLRKGYVDPLANVLDAAFSLVTGQRSRKYTLRGIAGGTGEGIVKGVKYFKTGYDPRNPEKKFDVRNISYSDKPLGKAAEVYTQAVFRLMGAQDQPFYYAALRNSLYDQALTEASRQKLRGAEKSAFVKQFITEPQTKAMDLADKEARYAVFQNETALGNVASKLKSAEGVGGDIAEFLVPFSQVPSSIATRMIERTPIGWATEIAKQIKAKKFDQRAMTQAIANGSMVIPLVGAGVALANSGAMTLGYPTEKKERDLWEAEGKQPYSIKVGDQWLSTNYFQPAGNLLAAGAEYQNAINEGEDPETAYANALAGAGKAFTEQSFLKGVSGGINALTDPTRSAEKFAEQTAGSVVPNIVRTAARATDPVQREMNGIVDAVTAGVPGARQTLPAKTNIYGEEVPRRGSMIDEIINPFKPSKDLTTENRMTAALRELQTKGEGVTPTQATKSTLKDADGNSLLDDKQLLELNKRVATEVSTEWSKVMEDPRYQKLSDGDKKRLLTRVNDSVYGAIKSEYGDTKLTKTQQLYKKGASVDYFANFDVSSEGLGDTKLPSDSLASSFLLDASAVDSLEKDTWSRLEVAKEYQPMIDQFNSKLPSGLPKLPYTNKTAELLSEFQKDRADNNWSKLELNDKAKDLAINTYKAQLTDNEQFITTLSDADIKTAAENGQISKEELDRIIAIDDITTKLGGSQMIGNKTRRLLGYGTIASKSSGGGGSGKKRNYKLNAFGDVSGEVSGNLRKLVEQATIKGV